MKCLHSASSFGAHARERNGVQLPTISVNFSEYLWRLRYLEGVTAEAITVITIGIHAIMVEARPLPPPLRCPA